MKDEIISQLQEIANKHEVDVTDVIDFINEISNELELATEKNEELHSDLEDAEADVKKLKSEIEDLEEENEVLEEENDSLDRRFQIPDGVNDNIILSGLLEDLFLNLSAIPTGELRAFVEKYTL